MISVSGCFSELLNKIHLFAYLYRSLYHERML